MKYFTRDLIERFGAPDDAVARKAEAEWEAANERYEQHLRSIEPKLPQHIRAFNELLLHDAVVTSLARQGDKLIMVLLKDIPPRDLVTLTYTLAEEPTIQRQDAACEQRTKVMDFQYDEFDLIEGGELVYYQSIVFGNGWEISIRFRDVQVALAEPLYPLPGISTPAPFGLPRSA
jgi:Protein of unknown function (DUF4085)